MKNNWIYISLFVLIAFAISAPVHLGCTESYFRTITNNSFISDWGYLLAGLGPFLAGILILVLHKSNSNRITLFGNNRVKNLLIAILPVISFTIIGLENTEEIDYHLYAFIYTSINVLYSFLEEFGWRRYLQNALEGVNKNIKYILIGSIWWVWHLRFTTDFDLFFFPLICIGGGYLLGKLADDTKSILPIVSMHTLVIILTNSGAITTNKILGVVLAIVGWFVIEKLMVQTNE